MGDNRSKKPERQYSRVHQWLSYYHGKASRCENPGCKNIKAKRFEWALKKGCQYEKRIENFIQLCPSCHRTYDFNPETGKKISIGQNPKKKAIIQMTLSGLFIKEFESITLASKQLNINKANLQMCLKGHQQTSGGYRWRFKKTLN